MLASRALLTILCAFVWVGCGDDDVPPPPDAGADAEAPDAGTDAGPPDAGPSCTVDLWDPTKGSIDRWPEPELVVADPTTATGKRLHFDETRWAAILATAAGFRTVLTEDLQDLDGFGVNSDAYFRFGRHFDETMFPTPEATATPTAGVGLVVLAPGAPRIEPVILHTTDMGSTLMLSPLHPLPPQGLVAAFVTRALTPAARGCLEPSSALAGVLAAPTPEVTQAIAAMTSLGIIDDPSADLVALTVYPTETTTDDSEAVAADIASRTVTLEAPPTCTDEALWRRCEGAFVAGDYRDADGVLRRAPGAPKPPVTTYRLPVTFWLPLTGTGPFPTLVYGHGLGSGRDQGAVLAAFAAPRGIMTVGIDAVQHGDHPTNPAPGSGTIPTVMRFFAIGDLSTRAIEVLEMRENFRQSTYDKLSLTRLLQAAPDVNGDAMPDVDPTRLGYLGVSLGGIMGSELLALTDAYHVAVLVVPGGRVISIVGDSADFSPLVLTLRPRGVTEGDVRRFYPILQSLIDRGDAASYGEHILRDRLVPGSMLVPSVLFGVVLDDRTVPNVSNYALARAVGVDIVPTVVRPEPGLGMTAMAPLSGNIAGGTATAGLLQFDVIREGGVVEQATHSNVGDSEVGVAAWFPFLDTHFTTGLAEIVDPYTTTGLAHGL